MLYRVYYMLYCTGKKEEERKSGESGHVKTLSSGFSLKTRGVTSPGSGVNLSHMSGTWVIVEIAFTCFTENEGCEDWRRRPCGSKAGASRGRPG